MATKTFKIGLSNTDKQNMAQDVYERVLALTFAEYDSANTYNKGDFVVYDDTLYQCKQDNTTGTWDSSKWQQATLQDLLDDIEGAVAFVNDKANVDGNYPTMTVGAADNLTPYDEESGTDQEQPFLLQGTGCGNGEQQVDTGALGLLKEKQGNTVVVNQHLQDFAVNSSNQYIAAVGANIDFISGHKYIFIPSPILTGNLTYYINTPYQELSLTQPTLITNVSYSQGIYIYNPDEETVNVTLKNKLIDLTQWFGSNDNIPAHLLSHPEDFFRYYQGSLAYNEGELVNSNGRYLKAIGRNQWDEEVEVVSDHIESKNYCKCIPNTTYYYYNGIGTGLGNGLKWYDKDKNLIKTDYIESGNTPTSPANACFFKFGVGAAYGTTYNHDITISIYYDGESGYDQYYPYEELANIDTGTETLRSAGSVKDSKAPDGTITRRIANFDIGSVNWTSAGNDVFYKVENSVKQNTVNTLCAKYSHSSHSWAEQEDKSYSIATGGGTTYIIIKDSSFNNDATAFKSGNNGVYLFYELETPTTEQGTTFSENVAIDDFGSMDFGGTNGVPQGASIFYAVDYKAFIDSLYNTLDGDATDIVKESELDTKLATLGYVKLTSVSGYDATKTQVLKNVEGTLTWVTEE